MRNCSKDVSFLMLWWIILVGEQHSNVHIVLCLRYFISTMWYSLFLQETWSTMKGFMLLDEAALTEMVKAVGLRKKVLKENVRRKCTYHFRLIDSEMLILLNMGCTCSVCDQIVHSNFFFNGTFNDTRQLACGQDGCLQTFRNSLLSKGMFKGSNMISLNLLMRIDILNVASLIIFAASLMVLKLFFGKLEWINDTRKDETFVYNWTVSTPKIQLLLPFITYFHYCSF